MTRSDPHHKTTAAASATAMAGWRQQLGELALACAGSVSAEEAQRLRDLRRLLAEAPEGALVRGVSVPSASRLDQLIGADAAATAALGMLGVECGYLLSRGAGGQHLATIILPGTAQETSASGDTLALALVGALGLALTEAEAVDPGLVERRSPERSSRLN